MGRRSVWEAPRGHAARSTGAAQPAFGAASRKSPARLRLMLATAEELRFAGRERACAPILLSPVLLVIACLPWLAPSPPSGLQALVSLLLFTGTLTLVVACRPRRVVVRLRPGDRQLLLAGRVEPLTEAARWVLTLERCSDAPDSTYVARLVLDADRHWPLLCAPEPAQLLRDLNTTLEYWACPVESHWDLPARAEPWSFRAPPRLAPESSPTEGIAITGGFAASGLRWVMSIMTALVLLDLAFLLVTASARVQSVHPLSLILPVLTGTCLVVVTLAITTMHTRLVVGNHVAQEHCALGLRNVLGKIPLESVRGVYLLGTSGSGQRHLLIDGAEGPLALPVAEQSAGSALREQVLAAVAQAVRDRGRPPPPRLSESRASVPHRSQSG